MVRGRDDVPIVTIVSTSDGSATTTPPPATPAASPTVSSAPAVDAHGGWPGLLGALAERRDLTRAAAAAAMADILAGRATPAQIAGLIVALRLKGETAEELTGMVTAMLSAAEPLAAPAGAVDIVGTGGSSHRRQYALNVSTMASIIAASAGAVICKHGNRRASSTSGSFDFLEALGLFVDLSPAQLTRCLDETGAGFAFARTFHPAMRHAAPVRAELGIPTVFNLLGPLANPGRVKRYVLGTASPELAATMAGVLANLGCERSWVVSGDGGLDEVAITGPTEVFEVTPDGIHRHQVDPGAVGLSVAASAAEVAGGSPEDNALIFHRLVEGELRGPRRDIVVLNAAAALVVAGVVDSLGLGVAAAEAAIDDGRARHKLAELAQVTHEVAKIA